MGAMLAVLMSVKGRVQGVGFRWWTQGEARYLGLSGYAENRADGSVEIRAQGEAEAVGKLIRMVSEQPTSRSRPGQVDDFAVKPVPVIPGSKAFSCR